VPVGLLCLPKHSVDAGPTDAKAARDFRRTHALGSQCADRRGIDRRPAPLVDARQFGPGNPLNLTFAAQVSLELREHAEHIDEGLAGCGGGVDRLFGRLQAGSLAAECPHDVLQIPNGSGQTIHAGDDQGVAPADELEDRGKLGSAGRAEPARDLRTDQIAPAALREASCTVRS
jgi:hypothetical protein